MFPAKNVESLGKNVCTKTLNRPRALNVIFIGL